MKASTRTVCLPRRIVSSNSEKEITCEKSLPDFSPDINRLIRAEATAYPEKTEAGKDGITVSGRVVFGLLYETDYKNKLAHTVISADFTQKFTPDSFSGGKIDADVDVVCSRVNCRLLSERKVLLRCLLTFGVSALELKCVEVLSPEAKESDTFFKTENIEIEKWLDPIESVFSFSERIETERPVGNIVCKSVTLSPLKAQSGDNVVTVTGNALFRALVEEENTDNSYFLVSKSIPLVMEFNADGGERFKASARPATLDASVELNDYGENRIISVSFSADGCLKPYAGESIELVADAFNPDYSNQTEISDIYYDIPVFADSQSFTVEKSFSTDGINLLTVLDTISIVNVISVAKEENGLRVRGNIAVSVLGVSDFGVVSVDTTEPFDELFTVNTPDGRVDYFASGYPIDASSVILNNETVSSKIVVLLEIYGFERKEVAAAVSMTMEESVKDEFADESVIFYYPDKGETLWDVAKQYYVNPAVIRGDNDAAFDADDTVRGRMIKIRRK